MKAKPLLTRTVGTHTLVIDAATSVRLGKIRQRGTSAELAVRAMLRELGIRPGRTRKRLPGSPDIVNVKGKWAVLAHGCYWHAHFGCARATVPKRNQAFWLEKFATNRRRDQRVVRELKRMGFRVCVLWECDIEERPNRVLERLKRFFEHAHARSCRRE